VQFISLVVIIMAHAISGVYFVHESGDCLSTATTESLDLIRIQLFRMVEMKLEIYFETCDGRMERRAVQLFGDIDGGSRRDTMMDITDEVFVNALKILDNLTKLYGGGSEDGDDEYLAMMYPLLESRIVDLQQREGRDCEVFQNYLRMVKHEMTFQEFNIKDHSAEDLLHLVSAMFARGEYENILQILPRILKLFSSAAAKTIYGDFVPLHLKIIHADSLSKTAETRSTTSLNQNNVKQEEEEVQEEGLSTSEDKEEGVSGEGHWSTVHRMGHIPNFGDALRYVGLPFERKTDPKTEGGLSSGTIESVATNKDVCKGALHFKLVSASGAGAGADSNSKSNDCSFVQCKIIMSKRKKNIYKVRFLWLPKEGLCVVFLLFAL
jgi:hypothetical protein